MPKYVEREITRPVNLCDDKGDLNREAAGWSRFPLHVCNLSGNFPRKKKWNYWLVLNPRFGFSATIANVDYLGVGAGFLLDLEKKTALDDAVVVPRGIGIKMPDTVEDDLRFDNKAMKIAFTHEPGIVRIRFDCPAFRGKKLTADIALQKSAEHETLNTVIPWSDKLFHFTSKQNTLPATGAVTYGDETHEFRPEDSYGILDFGRGIWPETIIWNWASFSTRQGRDLIGINLGAKWTDNTGHNENGLCLNGKLYKIMEDVVFTYDTSNFMKPWRMRTALSDTLDLTLTPVYDKGGGAQPSGDAPSAAAATHCMFGGFNGFVRAGDRKVEIKNAFGWAEQHIGKW